MEQSNNETQAILYWRRLPAHQAQPELSLQVLQDHSCRYLLLNGQRQGQMHLKNPNSVTYPHLELLLQLLEPLCWRHLLQLGLGAGEFSRAVTSRWPERQLSTVEQNATIVEVYQQFFLPVPTEQLLCTTAQQFCLQALAQQLCYEVIFVDLYPWPADWAWLLQQLIQLQSPAGVILLNLPAPEFLPLLQSFASKMHYRLQIFDVEGYLNKILQLHAE